MRTIVEIKKELVFNREMSDLMDVLKKTAIFEFQALFNLRKTKTFQEKYSSTLEELFKLLPPGSEHPFLTNPLNKVLLVIITSDMGFVGGLNTEVVDAGLRQLRKKDESRILVLGEKGILSLQEKGRSFDFLEGISSDMQFTLPEKVRDYIYAHCWKNKIGRVVISYPKFISFARQEIQTETLIPCGYLFKTEKEQAETEVKQPIQPEAERQKFIFEPTGPKVLDYLLKTYLAYKTYDIFWHSKLSEFAARSMHLDGSMQELSDMKKQVQLQYFRSKHEVTDRTIRDIFGGRLITLRKKQT
jgi:F-type H+-transporting ATPase subunit gamma